MENQPPANQPAAVGRPWFRLASLARLESLRQLDAGPAPAPAPAAPPPQPPVPRIPLPRPQAEPVQARPQRPPSPSPGNANGVPSVQPQRPPSPSPGNTNGIPSVQPQLPPRPEATPTPSPAAPVGAQITESQAARPPTPQSPRVIKQSSADPLPASPKIQHQLPPIKAPTPHPEPEPRPSPAPTPTRNMFTQQLLQQGNNNSPRVNVKTIADINDKPPVNSRPPSPKKETSPPNGTGLAAAPACKKKEEGGEMKIITMAGDNMGAYMEIGKHQQQQRGYLLQHHQTNGSESQGEDGKSDKGRNPMAAAAKGKPMAALVNSNTQSINNSIIFRSSCTQQSPGVHMTLLSQQQPKHKGGH